MFHGSWGRAWLGLDSLVLGFGWRALVTDECLQVIVILSFSLSVSHFLFVLSTRRKSCLCLSVLRMKVKFLLTGMFGKRNECDLECL
jgi:hypothetical protein